MAKKSFHPIFCFVYYSPPNDEFSVWVTDQKYLNRQIKSQEDRCDEDDEWSETMMKIDSLIEKSGLTGGEIESGADGMSVEYEFQENKQEIEKALTLVGFKHSNKYEDINNN